jgi:hypothetical protein
MAEIIVADCAGRAPESKKCGRLRLKIEAREGSAPALAKQ